MYRSVEHEAAVANVHKDFLFCRDHCALAALAILLMAVVAVARTAVSQVRPLSRPPFFSVCFAPLTSCRVLPSSLGSSIEIWAAFAGGRGRSGRLATMVTASAQQAAF
jgi:hypothetical protein